MKLSRKSQDHALLAALLAANLAAAYTSPALGVIGCIAAAALIFYIETH